MSSQVISYRFSLDEVAVLREKALPGESDNQTAQRLMRELLGLSTRASTEAAKVSTSSLDERIESVVEEKISTFSANCNDLLTRLQDCIQSLQERVQALETQATAQISDREDSLVDIVDGVAESQHPSDSQDVDIVDDLLTGKELAERLGVDPGTLTKNRTKTTFSEWTRGKDPEGVTWQYLPEVKRYTPMSTVVSTESTDDDHLAGWKAKVDEVVGAL